MKVVLAVGALSNAQTESTSNKAESDSNALIPLYSLSALLDMDSYFLALCGNHHFGVFRLSSHQGPYLVNTWNRISTYWDVL